MKAILGIALIGALAGVYFMQSATNQVTDDEISLMFENFVMENRRSYASVDEYKHRLAVFKTNLGVAAKYQEDQDEAVFGVTIFMDMTQQEFKNMLAFKEPAGQRPVKHTQVTGNTDKDWRGQYGVVKD